MADYQNNRDWDRDDYERWRRHGQRRGWFDRVRDDIEAAFGNEDARRRVEEDRARRQHRRRWQPNPLDRSFSGFAGPEYGYSPSERYGQIYSNEPYGGWDNAPYPEYEWNDPYVPHMQHNRAYGRPYNSRTFGQSPDVEVWEHRQTDKGEASIMGGGQFHYANAWGLGPRNFHREAERIREDVIDRLTRHPEIDASDIDIQVKDQIVTLSGQVPDRYQKRLAADLAEDVFGVRDVHNQLRVQQAPGRTHLNEERQMSRTPSNNR